MKKIKSLKEFIVGKKYLFISNIDNHKSIGISTNIKEGVVKFKIYQSTYKIIHPDEECYLDETSFNDGKAYLLTENEFRVEIL